MWEGDAEAAWAAAVDGGVPQRVWMRLAAARKDTHPDDALPIFQREVEDLIETKNNRGYADAVALMGEIRELLERVGRPDEFPSYVTAVRAAHKPKRNLIKLLDATSW